MSQTLKPQTEPCMQIKTALEAQRREVNLLKKQLQEKVADLQKANAALEEAALLKSALASGLGHELRSPLNTIMGFTGVMLMGITGEISAEQKKQLNMIKSSASHLLSLINDLHDIFRIEAGKMELSAEEFALGDVTREVADELAFEIKDKDLTLCVEGSQGLTVLGDKRRVKQVLMNLAANAVKLTETGSVKISSEVIENGKLGITISDTGVGIKHEDMGRLFLPFQHIDLSPAKPSEGTHLRLYLSQKLARLMGGEITAASRYGKGSTFNFVLPIRRKEDK